MYKCVCTTIYFFIYGISKTLLQQVSLNSTCERKSINIEEVFSKAVQSWRMLSSEVLKASTYWDSHSGRFFELQSKLRLSAAQGLAPTTHSHGITERTELWYCCPPTSIYIQTKVINQDNSITHSAFFKIKNEQHRDFSLFLGVYYMQELCILFSQQHFVSKLCYL